VSAAVRNGDLDVNCKGKVVRCAARSTCGKKTGFVTCAQCSPGTCDTTTNLCDDGVTPCPVAPATCPPVLDHCSTKSDAALCISRRGEPGVVGWGSCCAAGCPLDCSSSVSGRGPPRECRGGPCLATPDARRARSQPAVHPRHQGQQALRRLP